MKDLWSTLQTDLAPAIREEERRIWRRAQEKALAVIHLYCEKEQKIMIAKCETGVDAWETLAERYASTEISNVMRVEDAFGKAKRKPGQTIGEWSGHIRGLANQLREVGVDVSAERVAHRILSGAGKEFGSTRAALRARKGALTVDLVVQQLMEAEAKRLEDEEENGKKNSILVGQHATTITTQYNVNPR